jgi:hypothetical protein
MYFARLGPLLRRPLWNTYAQFGMQRMGSSASEKLQRGHYRYASMAMLAVAIYALAVLAIARPLAGGSEPGRLGRAAVVFGVASIMRRGPPPGVGLGWALAAMA